LLGIKSFVVNNIKMDTNFKITAIGEDFEHLFDMTENELKKISASRMIVKSKPGIPCRVSLEDAEINEEVILFPYEHHKVTTPYKSSGPIFVRKNAKKAELKINEIPLMLNHRLLSLRIYDVYGMMIDAKTVKGNELKAEIQQILGNTNASYIQVHNAGPGCYNCQIIRAERNVA
jgi:uncharacterized protein DUF1203